MKKMSALTAACCLMSAASAAHGGVTDAELRAALKSRKGSVLPWEEPKVSLKLASGEVRGRVTALGVQRYLGVPFAQPPVGPLRWEAPQPVADWEGVREAAEYSKSCAQEPNVFDDFSGVSEDCLYLNLWMPDKPAPPAGEKYAAMIFFYGGSWTSGSAMFPLYTGEALTLGNNATVVVTVNYRLAALGFLGSDFLRASDGSAGNWGLQDQRMAMRWVHANAEHLNVDTSRIMIFGESAGAGSVSSHLVSHRSRGLFTRAAMESGPFADWTSITLEEGRPRFSQFAAHLNCTLPASGVAANATPAEIAEVQRCLRSRNLTQVLAGMKHLPSPEGLVGWSPTVDGVEFTADVQILGAQGDIANVPVLLGTNKNEGTTFVNLDKKANASDLDRYVVSQIDKSAAITAEIEAAYPPSSFEKTLFASAAWWAASEMLGDAEMTCAARRTARDLTTLRGPDAAAAFVYWFTYELSLIPLLELVTEKPFGVFHGSELALVFCAEELLLEEKERALSKKVRQYWTNFAYSGDPNVGRTDAGLPHWPAHVQATNLTLNLNMELGTISNLKASRCDLWDRVGPVHPRN
eukprot:Hpha_TRINITY_DN13493_c0_g1::TRINITY_DN13493_c0_g1_i1::g.131171::m.131171/K01049/ACHE; acetylcholinesterase